MSSGHLASDRASPSRKGVIKTSYARHDTGTAGKHGGRPYWTAEICGTYKDSAEKFCISRVRIGDFRFGAGKADAIETVERYPAGRELDIYYSPQNPQETVLEAYSSWKEMLILLALGIAFLLLPVVLWLLRKQLEPDRYRNQ